MTRHPPCPPIPHRSLPRCALLACCARLRVASTPVDFSCLLIVGSDTFRQRSADVGNHVRLYPAELAVRARVKRRRVLNIPETYSCSLLSQFAAGAFSCCRYVAQPIEQCVSCGARTPRHLNVRKRHVQSEALCPCGHMPEASSSKESQIVNYRGVGWRKLQLTPAYNGSLDGPVKKSGMREIIYVSLCTGFDNSCQRPGQTEYNTLTTSLGP
jgi:hypothetical protein